MKETELNKVHKAKIYPVYFDDVESGKKNFDVRLDDRTPRYKIGDLILFQEYSPNLNKYSGRETLKEITYKLDGGQWGIDDDCCVLGLTLPSDEGDKTKSSYPEAPRPKDDKTDEIEELAIKLYGIFDETNNNWPYENQDIKDKFILRAKDLIITGYSKPSSNVVWPEKKEVKWSNNLRILKAEAEGWNAAIDACKEIAKLPSCWKEDLNPVAVLDCMNEMAKDNKDAYLFPLIAQAICSRFVRPSVDECKCVYEGEPHAIEFINAPSGKQWAIGGTNTKDRFKFCPWCGGAIVAHLNNTK